MNRATNETLPLRDAALRGWLSDTLFALNQFATGYVTSVFVEPFKGYWVYVQAPQGVVLLIDNTPTRQMAPDRSNFPKQAGFDGWAVGHR
jgi:hypothetical protein